MEWFEDFIEETRVLWHEQKEDLTEESDEIIVEEKYEISKKEIGIKGEDVTGYILSQFGFIIGYPKNSETPADVWGIKDNGLIHIALIQVKTTQSEEGSAELLNEDDILLLRKLTKFVLDRFKNSEIVPEEFKRKTVVVSNGYTGIRAAPQKKEIIESKSFTFWMPRKYEKEKDQFKELINIVHRLGY